VKNILKKSTPAPTLNDRYGSALATHSAALSVFDDVLTDLLVSEAELHDVAAEAQFEIDAREEAHAIELRRLQGAHYDKVLGLADLRDVASDDAAFIAQKAENIRALVA
jgi:hypothetical protein